MKIKIVNKSKYPCPKYYTSGSSGIDLYANLIKDVVLKPMDRKLIPTGIYIELPSGYEGQIRSRSGLALNKGIICLNSPGTIDTDYRGEIKVILINLSHQSYKIISGDKIAQIVFSKYLKVSFEERKKLSSTSRGDKGFGSSDEK